MVQAATHTLPAEQGSPPFPIFRLAGRLVGFCEQHNETNQCPCTVYVQPHFHSHCLTPPAVGFVSRCVFLALHLFLGQQTDLLWFLDPAMQGFGLATRPFTHRHRVSPSALLQGPAGTCRDLLHCIIVPIGGIIPLWNIHEHLP